MQQERKGGEGGEPARFASQKRLKPANTAIQGGREKERAMPPTSSKKGEGGGNMGNAGRGLKKV